MKYSMIPVLALATFAIAAPAIEKDDGKIITAALNTDDPVAFNWPSNLLCNEQYGVAIAAERDHILDALQGMIGDQHTITTTLNDGEVPRIPPGPGACSDSIEASYGTEVVVCNDDPHNSLVVNRDQLAKYVRSIYEWCSGDPALQAKTASKNGVRGQYFVTDHDYNFNVAVRGS